MHSRIHERRRLGSDVREAHRGFDFRRANDPRFEKLGETRDVLLPPCLCFVIGNVERRQAPADRASEKNRELPDCQPR